MPVSATNRQLVAVDFDVDMVNFVANMVDLVASVYGAKATRSTFNKVDHVEVNLVTSVYRAYVNALQMELFSHGSSVCVSGP